MKIRGPVTLGQHRHELDRPIDKVISSKPELLTVSNPKSIGDIGKMDEKTYKDEIKVLDIVAASAEQKKQHELFKVASGKSEIHF